MEEVKAEVSWELKIAADVIVTEPPTVEEVRITRILDAGKIYTGNGLKGLTFEKYVQMLEESQDILQKLY